MEDKKRWKQRKQEIQGIFRETRRSGRILPYDVLQDEDPDVLREILRKEQSDMVHIRHPLEDYIKNKLEMKSFSISVKYDPIRAGDGRYKIHAPFGSEDAVIYHKATNNVDMQLIIAEALAFIALDYVRVVKEAQKQQKDKETTTTQKIKEKSDDSDEIQFNGYDLLYLTWRLLVLYAEMDNGSFLRNIYVLQKGQVADELRKIYEEFDPERSVKRAEIETILKGIFPDYPDVSVPALNCEKKLVETYIKDQNSGKAHIENFKIKIKPTKPNYDKPYGLIAFHHSRELKRIGGVIQHIPREDLKLFLGGSKVAKCLNIISANAQNIVRCVISHEIAHAFLGYEYGCTDGYAQNSANRTKETERDAFYFARILLEHREMLYCGNIECPEFIDARENWKRIIEYVYREDRCFDEEYLKWILED